MREEQLRLKRANMADKEKVCSTNDKEAPNTDSEETAQQRTILCQNSKLTNEVAELRNAFQQQKTELTAVKTTLAKMTKQQDDLETERLAARK